MNIKINKKLFFPLLIIFIFILYSLPFFQPGFYLSHDGEPQVARITAFYKAIVDGQIPPRWAGDLNYGYGLPTLSFFFPLEGYLGTVIRLLGLSLQNVYKIEMVGAFILAPLFFYLWASLLFKKHVAFAGTLFFGLAPYHFLDIYVRGQLAEMLAFVFIPLVLFFVERNIKKHSLINIIGGGTSLAFLILSHSIISLLFTGIICLYISFRNYKSKKALSFNLSIIIFGLILSAYFWIPALFEGKYINSKLFVGDFYKDHFLSIDKLFYSPWGFGPDINKNGGLSSRIGIVPMFLTLFSIGYFSIKRKKEVLFWIFIFLSAIFLSTKYSKFIWDNIHMIQQFQFPWRLTAVSSFVSSVLIMYLFSKIKNIKIIFIILVVFLISSLQFIGFAGYVDKKDSFYINYPGSASFHGEATTIWTAGEAHEYPKERSQVIGGKATIKEIERKSNNHSYEINALSDVRILENTVYFPGWKVVSNLKEIPIEFQDSNYRGLITYNLPKGQHNVQIVFEETKLRLFSDIITILGIAILFLLTIIVLLSKNKKI